MQQEPKHESGWETSGPLKAPRPKVPRPTSFYLLLATPLVMLLGLRLIAFRTDPWQFAFVLSLLFVFFGIVLLRAVMDLFEIARTSFRRDKEAFRDTLGDDLFLRELAQRMKEGEDEGSGS